MGRRAARATHLALWVVGGFLYAVFVIPRWWVLTGDIPATAATFGRIATGVPIAAAAVPVGLALQHSLKQESRIPELALRLRAWSAVLHLVAGVLIITTAVAEIWLNSQAAAPWLFGVYGGAGSLAVLAALAFVLSYPAEMPPPPPKPAKIRPEKKSEKAPKKRRTRTRGRKQSEDGPGQEAGAPGEEDEASAEETEAPAEQPDSEDSVAHSTDPSEHDSMADAGGESEAVSEAKTDDDGTPALSTDDEVAGPDSTAAAEIDAAAKVEEHSPVEGPPDQPSSPSGSESGNRPVGKKRHRLRR